MNAIIRKIRAIIIDDNSKTKLHLRQSARAMGYFEEIIEFSSISEARLFLMSAPIQYGLIFISDSLDKHDVVSFISFAKELHAVRDAASILVTEQTGEQAHLAKSLINGADGILYSPYSVDAFETILELAMKVKKANEDTRERAALKLLLKELMLKVDQLAYLKTMGYNGAKVKYEIADLVFVLESLSEESLKRYYDEMTRYCENVKITKNHVKEAVPGGASKRVNQKRTAKALDSIKKAMAA